MWWKIEGEKRLYVNLNIVKKLIVSENKQVIILHFENGDIEKVNIDEHEYVSLMEALNDNR